jgi:hypothetical protein
MNLLEEIDKLSKKELKNVVLHCIGIYNKQFGEKLPFVYCPLCGEEIKKKMKEKPIFSGKESKKMWDEINHAKTVEDLKEAVYDICCHLQELESRLEGKI